MDRNKQPTPRQRTGHRRGPRALVRRSPRGGGGFTLIEMLAVIAIIGILMTVAVLGFNAFGRNVRLKTAARLIQQHLDNARQLAMTRQGVSGVSFVPKVEPERDYLLIHWKKAAASPEQIGNTYELPEGIEFGAKDAVPTSMPPHDINFTSTGRAKAEGGSGSLTFKIHDVESEREREITVLPVTGHAEVKEAE